MSTSEDRAESIARYLTETGEAEDQRTAAVVYALLAVADRLLDLAAAVEQAGWRKE